MSKNLSDQPLIRAERLAQDTEKISSRLDADITQKNIAFRQLLEAAGNTPDQIDAAIGAAPEDEAPEILAVFQDLDKFEAEGREFWEKQRKQAEGK